MTHCRTLLIKYYVAVAIRSTGVGNTFKNSLTENTDLKKEEQSCTCVVEIQPLVPMAEFCACLMDTSTTFGILKLGTLHSNQHFSLVPG